MHGWSEAKGVRYPAPIAYAIWSCLVTPNTGTLGKREQGGLVASDGGRHPPFGQLPRARSPPSELWVPGLRPVARGADGSQRTAQRTAPLETPVMVMPYREFREKLNTAFQAAGADRDIGTHAFHRGSATAAVNSQAERALVQELSRWACQKTYDRHYINGVAARKKVTATSWASSSSCTMAGAFKTCLH
jgi:hypothetical protein